MNRNEKVLDDFIRYCIMHPEERFWQALRNWSKFSFVFVATTHENSSLQDTFYWEGKDK